MKLTSAVKSTDAGQGFKGLGTIDGLTTGGATSTVMVVLHDIPASEYVNV